MVAKPAKVYDRKARVRSSGLAMEGVVRLIYTPRSHFARKVRLLMAALGLEAELVDAGNAADADPALFGPNPLMKVPTLLDGDQVVFESDHIAAWIVRRHDPEDRFAVLTANPGELNARAVMNGVMGLEAELILAARTGLDTEHPRFDKMRTALVQGLQWLEAHASLVGERPGYLGFHFLAMWDHIALYGLVPLAYPSLQSRRQACARWPFADASAPPPL